MKAARMLTMVSLLLLSAGSADAQLLLSIAGPGLNQGDPLRPIALYDETVDAGLEIYIQDLWRERVFPFHSGWVMRLVTSQHHQNDFPNLPDTEPGPFYFCLVWFEPGEVFVNFSVGQTGNWLWIVDDLWRGYVPTDFTHLSVMFMEASGACSPLGGTMRYVEIPITWLTEPVPTDDTSWSAIKGMYR